MRTYLSYTKIEKIKCLFLSIRHYMKKLWKLYEFKIIFIDIYLFNKIYDNFYVNIQLL